MNHLYLSFSLPRALLLLVLRFRDVSWRSSIRRRSFVDARQNRRLPRMSADRTRTQRRSGHAPAHPIGAHPGHGRGPPTSRQTDARRRSAATARRGQRLSNHLRSHRSLSILGKMFRLDEL